MESKKINQLATELAPALSDLTIIGDPTTGISKKITLSQMASLFTGTVEEYPNVASFPLVGVADTIYIALDTNVLYRWDTTLTSYVELSPNIINSLVFSDANGFDGNISLVGSTATLTITTALTTGSVPFIGASGALSQDNANLFFDDTNNRLGINTNAPTTALDVFGSGIIGRLNGTSTNNSFLGFSSAGTNQWSIGNVQSDQRFRIYSEANTAELVSVLQTGEFGVGIANPTTKLHIDGGATALIANLDANVSVAKSISFRSDNSNRINLEVSGTESGSNAGGNFFIRRYSDAGALIDTPLTLTRSNGQFTILNQLNISTLESINGTNTVSLGAGFINLLNFASYNSSANQSITLGMGLAASVNNLIAYQYYLSVGGNATGQNFTLASKRNGIADLTILTANTLGQITINNLNTGAVYSSSGLLSNLAPSLTATGGTITTSGGYKYHTFTSSGTFQVTSGLAYVEVAVVAGGGAGAGAGNGLAYYSGAGGGGGVVYHPAYFVETGSYTVTIGAGGGGGTSPGANGSNSLFANITALGGGGGGKANGDNPGTADHVGQPGGSGGGGGSQTGIGGASVKYLGGGIPYGNAGGTPNGVGGGGGGAGGVGSGNMTGGLGILIFNLSSRIAGGGGGGSFSNPGNTGTDGGGNSGWYNGSNYSDSNGDPGTANTGGGGGGAGFNFAVGGNGGSGIVIIRYKA